MTIRGKLKLAHIAMACLAVMLVTSFVVLEKELENEFQGIHEQTGRVHMALMVLRLTGQKTILSANKTILLSHLEDEKRSSREHRETGSFRPKTQEWTIQDIQTANTQLQSSLATYTSLVNAYFPDELSTLRSVEAATTRLVETNANIIETAGQGEKGSLFFENLEKVETLGGDFLRVLNMALEAESQEASEQLAHIESSFELGERFALIGGGIVVVLVLAIGATVSNAITRPVQSLASAVHRIGHGEFDVQLEAGKRDEIGQLASAVGNMSQKLKAMTSNLEGEVIERTRAEADLKQTNQAAELLRKIAVAANHADNPDDAIRVCLDEVCAYSGCAVGHAYRFGPDGTGDLISANLWHLDDPVRYEALRQETEGKRVPPEGGIAGRVLASAEPQWTEADPSHGVSQRRKVRIEAGLKSGFAVPVMVGPQVGAVLEFFSGEVFERDEELLEITSQVGVLIGRVIERQRNEQTLLDSKEEAELASRSKSEFLANMSHELRTPLNAINGFSELLAEEAFGPLGNEEYKKFSQAINESGQHLLALINDILDISKIEVGSIELSEEPFDMVPVIDSCITMIRERATDGGVELSLDIAEATLPQLLADKTRIRQVVLNLLSNAVKFTERGGGVTLKAWHNEGSGFVLQVIDTGIGMAAGDIPKALTRFQQVDSGLTRKQEGTGLGLPLVKSLVEQHGGSLDLQSELGVGTTVTMRLPAVRTIKEAA